jgi:hypothetical protein
VPLRQTLAYWPSHLFGEPAFLDEVGLRDYHVSEGPQQLGATGTVVWLRELAVDVPGVDGLSIAFLSDGRVTAVPFEIDILPELAVRLPDLRVTLRLRNKLLRPVRRVDGKWVPVLDQRGDPAPAELQVGKAGIGFSLDDGVELLMPAGAPQLELGPVAIGDTGVVVELHGLVPYLSSAQTPPAGAPPGFRGLAVQSLRLYLPPDLDVPLKPTDLTFSDLYLGTGGFSGTISGSWSNWKFDVNERTYSGDGSGTLFGIPVALKSLAFTFTQSVPTASKLTAEALLPFFDQPVGIDISIGVDGGLAVALSAVQPPGVTVSSGLATFTKKDLLTARLDSLGFAVDAGVLTVRIGGQIKPLVGAPQLDWPNFGVKSLSIDSAGNVRIDGGWLDLPRQFGLDFYGFRIEITKLGFGQTDDGGRWVGFSGGLKLVEGLPAGASVEGLRVIWYPDGRTALTLNGVGVEFEVPGALSFKGAIAYRPVAGGHRFDGAIKLRLVSLDLTIDAQLVVGISTDQATGRRYGFFAIYLACELPAGIPLFSTGLGLFGMAGLFALNMEPNRKPEEEWYDGWYKRGTPGVADLANKWGNNLGSLALGAGVTLGTQADNGFTFAGRILLVIVFPGPILLLEGKANLLKKRSELSGPAEPTFRTLAVLDNRAGSFLAGLDAFYRTGTKAELIDIHGTVKTYFDFHDAGAWYFNVGEQEPREKRVRAELFRLFNANAYFMLNARRLATGAWIGYETGATFGPVKVSFEAWIEGSALLSFKPAYFHGDLWLHGRVMLAVFGFGFALGLDARVAADVFDPFIVRVELKVTIDLPWFLPDFEVELSKQWGPEPNPPALPGTLQDVSVEHFKVTTTWPLPRTGSPPLLAPDYDRGDGYLADPGAVPAFAATGPPASNAPVVPLDARPRVTFGRPVHDEARVGVNPQPVQPGAQPEAGWEWIGDPARNEGPVRVRSELREIELQRWDPAANAWSVVARAPDPAAGQRKLFGSWAPVPHLPAGEPTAGSQPAAANAKLWLWSKTPFDATRHAGSAWDEWFTTAFPDYPCPPPVPERQVCCDFRDLPPGQLIASPWNCPGHPEIVVSWLGPPRQVTVLDEPVDGLTEALCIPGTYVDAGGNEVPETVTITCGGEATEVTITLPPERVEPTRRCADLTTQPLGPGPNPRVVDRVTFTARGAGGVPLAQTRVGALGGDPGLEIDRRLDADLPAPATEVELTLTTRAAVALVEAFDGRGQLVAAVPMTQPPGAPETVRLGGRGIVRVSVTAPQGETVLHRLCHLAPPIAVIVTDGGGSRPVEVGSGTIHAGGPGLRTVELSGGERICIVKVCLTLPPDPNEVARRDELVAHMVSELERWSDEGEVLAPDTDYRLRVVTRLTARSDQQLAGYTAVGGAWQLTRDQTQYAFFRTQGPPGLTTLSTPDRALDDLTLYVRQTIPPTVPGPGQPPPLPRPVYRAYDAGVAFDADADHVELMYRLARRDLGLYLFDANNQPARDAQGRLVALANQWSGVQRTLTRAERTWSTLVEGSACVPAATRNFAPEKSLTSAETRVLAPDAVHEARLIPLLLHEDFGGPAGQRPAGWTVIDEGTQGGPSTWAVARHDRLAGTAATVTGSTVQLDGTASLGGLVAGLDLITLAADVARPSGRWLVTAVNAAARTLTVDGKPQLTATTTAWEIPALRGVRQGSRISGGSDDGRDPIKPGTVLLRGGAAWTDYRLQVTVCSTSDGAIGVLVRAADAAHCYRLSMDRARRYRRLVRIAGATHTVLAEDRFAFARNNDYQLTVEAVGPRLRVYQDGALVFDVNDTAFTAGGVGLYCWDDPGAFFAEVRLDDLREQAPVVYRFKFTTSRFATFAHHAHSFQDEVWPAAADIAGLLTPAVQPGTAAASAAPAEPERRAYATLAATLGPRAGTPRSAVEVTRVEHAGDALGWLVETPEPIDWSRTALGLRRSEPGGVRPDPPGALKLTAATFATTAPNQESVTVLAREPVDPTGYRIELRSLPGALAPEDTGPLLTDEFDGPAGGLLFAEDFGPNALDRYEVVNEESSFFPAVWAVGNGHIVQSGQYFVASADPDKPGTMAILKVPAAGDTRISATLRSEDLDAIGLVFRYRAEGTFYRFSIARDNGYRRLVKKVAGVTTVLWEDQRLAEVGHSYRLVVEAYGDRMLGWLDDELVFGVRDPDIPSGRTGFYAWKNMGAHFEALRIEALGVDPVLWQPDLAHLPSLPGSRVVDEPGTSGGPSVWAGAGAALTQTSAIGGPGEAWTPVPAPPAFDVAAGPAGEAWAVVQARLPDGFRLLRWEDGGWSEIPTSGAVHVAVDPAGRAWTVGRSGRATAWTGSGWDPLPGAGLRDIAAGGRAVCALGSDSRPGGWVVLRFEGGAWQEVGDRGGVALAVDPDGNPWVADDSGQLYRWDGSSWQQVPGTTARDLALAFDASPPWVISTTAAADGFEVRRRIGRAWQSAGLGAVAVAAGSAGSAWALDASGALFRWAGPDPARPGTYVAGGPAGADDWEDVQIAVRLRSDGDGAIGLLFRYRDAANWYRFSLDRAGCVRRLVKMADGTVSVLWQDTVPPEAGRTYAVTITAAGPELRGILDGAPLFTVQDTSHSHGRVGLYCRANPTARFEQLIVTDRTRRVGRWVVNDLGITGGPSVWLRRAGALVQTAPIDGTMAVAGEPDWTDYRVTTRLGADDTGTVGVAVRVADDDNFYRLAFDAAADRRSLIRRARGADTVLWERPGGYLPGEVLTVTVDAVGPRLRAWLGATPLFDLVDGAHPAGRVGLYTAGMQDAAFERVKVRQPPLEALARFTDRFAAGNRGAFTIVDPRRGPRGRWGVVDGELRQVAAVPDGTAAVAGDPAWTDVIVGARLRTGTAGTVGLLLRYQDQERHYRFVLDVDSGARRLEKVEPGGVTPLWEDAGAAVVADQMAEVSVAALGGSLRGFLDGVPLFKVEDPDPRFAAGRFGLWSAAGPGAGFSAVRVHGGEQSFTGWLLDEPFESLVPGRWTMVDQGDVDGPSAWQVTGGALRQTSLIRDTSLGPDRPGTMALAGDPGWGDYRLVVRLHTGGTGSIGALVRRTAAGDHYRFMADAQAGRRRLVKVAGGAATVLWEDAGPFSAGTDHVLTLDCVGARLSGYLDGQRLFSIVDADLSAGGVGLHCWGNDGAAFLEARVAPLVWSPTFTFGDEDRLPAGSQVRVFSGNRADAPAPEPGVAQRFAAAFDERGAIKFPPGGAELRLRTPDGAPGHARLFLPALAYTAVPAAGLRMVRKADGTGVFLCLENAVAITPGDYRLELTFRRDNLTQDPGSQVLRQAGDTGPERVILDLPWTTVAPVRLT